MPSDDSFRKLTDEQWVWLFANQLIDNEEKLEQMCDKCKEDATSKNKCIRCGTSLTNHDKFVNPNFDNSKFERLSKGTVGDEDIDLGIVNRIMGDRLEDE